MNLQNKLLLGRLLGEIFRLQKSTGLSTESDSTIFGLRNGFEPVIDEYLDELSLITTAQVKSAQAILQPYFDDTAKLATLKGFYDIEKQLAAAGVDRHAAIQIFRYFQASGSYVSVLAKMNSTDSPEECRSFELRDHDK